MKRLVLPLILSLSACTEPAPPTAAQPSAAAKAAPPAADAKIAPPPAGAVVGPGVQEDGSIVTAVTWFPGPLDAALAAAAAEDKLVFVDVGAYWCPPCHRLDEETFVAAEVGEALGAKYIAVHIDAEKGAGPEIVERYHVQAYPTLLVLEATGIEKGRIVDFVAPADLLVALTAIESGGNVLAKLRDAVDNDPDDLWARYELGHAYLLAADTEAAAAEFSVVEVADPGNELGFASKIAYDRAMFDIYKMKRDLPGAIEAYRTLQARFPDSKEVTPAYRQISRILCEQGKPQEATAELDAMLDRDPDDVGLRASYGWSAFRDKCVLSRGLEVVDAGLAAHPEDAQLHYLRAELRLALDDRAGAREAMAQASAAEPDSAYYKRRIRELAGEPVTP
jgi:tetratricopeptide (TPR) repeat protein